MMISQASLTSLSGLTGQVRNERMGRRRSASAPPAMAAAMSIILRAQKPESGPMVACLVVLLKIASALCSAAVSGGTSWAPRGRSSTSISGRASMIREQSATSCLRLSCSSPVYGSTTWMPSPKLVKPTRPSSSTTSLAGSRPHMTTVEGAERTASSTRCAGRRTMFVVAVDLGARRREDLPGFVVFDEDARARQHFERRAVDLPQLVVGEHLEPEAAALARSRARVPDHRQPPAVRSLNFSTLLIGTSSTRAMLNFASIWLACHGWLIA